MILMCTLKILKYGFVKKEKAFTRPPSNENNSKKVHDVSLVVTYNPEFENLSQVIKKPFSYYMQGNRLRKYFHLHHFFASEVRET